MAYRNKEECEREAERLGIDAESLTWPELQKAVSNALKLEEMGLSIPMKPVEEKDEAPEAKAKKANPKPKKSEDDWNHIKDYYGKTIIISPELSPERYRRVKYDEELGPDYDVTERHFDINSEGMVFDTAGGSTEHSNKVDQYHDYTTGTYRLKEHKDRKVVAMSTVPKENSGMIFRPGIDYAVVVTWQGKSGYLWQHATLPNVKALLLESGYYNEYKHLFKDNNMWYAAGKQLVCDPHLVHRVFKEIEEKEAKRRDEEKMRYKFYKGAE